MGQDKAYSKLKISGLIKNPVFLVFFLVGIITIGLSIYNYVLPTYVKDGEFHSHYNNYLIF